MKKISCITFFFLFVACNALWSQITSVKNIYFATGKHELSYIIKSKIDSVLYSLPETDSTQTVTLKKVFVNGHTDNVGDSIYNIKLSEKRTASVTQYLIKKGIPKNILKQNYWGEDKPSKSNESDLGKIQNRRVDIIFKYELKKKTINPVTAATVNIANPCNRDTLIDLPLSGKMKIKVCDYEKRKNCLSFEDISDPDSIRRNNAYTVDNTGAPIISGGMYKVNVCNEKCSEKFITVLKPVTYICGFELPVPMNIYIFNGNRWQAFPKSRIREIRIEGVKYYEATIDLCFFTNAGGGKINWDFPMNCQGPKKIKSTKFFAKDGLKIIQASIHSVDPLYSYPMQVAENKKSASTKLTCPCVDPLAFFKVLTPKGDTLIMKDKPINRLNKKYTRGNCKTGNYLEGIKNLGVFKIKEKTIYRKYFLYELDFDNFKVEY